MTESTISATRFAWHCLGSPAHPPPEQKRGPRYGPDDRCWLCGGVTQGTGWPRALPSTFTNHNLAAVPTSQTVCAPCLYLASGETWAAYVATHPELALKAGHPLSWRTYSHVFTTEHHDCPIHTGWRSWLLDPPEPPFLFVIAESGQKHLLFRARVAYDRDRYPVQIEEDLVFIDRARFAACLEDFERLYALGFSKDSVRSGHYHPGQLLKTGVAVWRAAETAFAPWRQSDPQLVRLAHWCAQKPQEEVMPDP